MKKRFAIIIFAALITSLTCIYATSLDGIIRNGFDINFNSQPVGYSSVIYNNTHFVPLRKTFEQFESVVFYRSSDNKILAISRDGDTITHTIGEKTITINGNIKTFENPSITKDFETYIPVDMFSEVMHPDRISYNKRQLYIDKQMITNDYHKIIKNILAYAKNTNFKPEKFKEYKDYSGKNPSMPVEDVVFRVNVGLASPFYENITTIEHPYELSVLVNKYNKLPPGFKQYNLVNMEPKYTIRDGKQYLLAGVANESYARMADAAFAQGLSMMVVSAYRTEDYQRGLYNNKINTSGKVYADRYSARPGHSEHQTGLAVDIGSTLVSFEYSNEFKWLQNHAHEYGFILRYPKGKEWITGYAYEPWHYRYVGVETATKIYQEGITFEEYYAKYKHISEYK